MVPGPEDQIDYSLEEGVLYLSSSHSWERSLLIEDSNDLKIFDPRYENDILTLRIKRISKPANDNTDKLIQDDMISKINLNNVRALMNKGHSLVSLKQYNDALLWFDKVLEIDPKHIGALNGKGNALLGLEQYNDALLWFDKVLEIDPKTHRCIKR